MNDILVLYFEIILEAIAFDSHDGNIFSITESTTHSLTESQKRRIVMWACERTSLSVKEIITKFDSLIRHLKLPEFRLRTPSLRKQYTYCGPGTNLESRLTHNDEPRHFSRPINKIDEICLLHDIDYKRARKDDGTVRKADKLMLKRLREIGQQDLTFQEKHGRFVCRFFISLKYALRL